MAFFAQKRVKMACFPNATVGGPARRVKSDAAASRTATPRKQLAAKHKSPLRRADKFQGGVAQQVGDLMELEFEYPEDRMFFANLLAAGDNATSDINKGRKPGDGYSWVECFHKPVAAWQHSR
jgi:hypothetical protein